MFETLKFPQDSRILEVGFGHGNWAAWAASQVPQGAVVGVDIDPNMVEWARQQFPAATYPNLEYRLGDAQTLDFQAEPFDFAMSNACLHYLKHPGMAFSAMARHLKPGGRLCVVCLGQGNLRDLHKSVERVMTEKRWERYFENYEPVFPLADGVSCEPWLAEAGLQKKQARLYNEPMNFPNRWAFQDWVNNNFGRYFDFVPEAMRGTFSDAIMDAYCKKAKPTQPVRAFRVWLQLDAVKKG